MNLMSKLEEALEKASKLRVSKDVSDKGLPVIPKDIEHGKVINDCIVTIKNPNSPIAEEYRRLKSILLRETKKDFLNTIMVTSAIDSEGKSLSSINLAITMAQEIDHSILIVDADLRKPAIENYLDIKYQYGLSDYLTRDMNITDVLVKTGIGNLVILPAGPAVENPVELLSSDKMKTLIKELKQRYMDRYIIIDTPPILPFADAIAIGSLVDGIVFVVKEGLARKKTVENALNLIKDFKILGIVFNGVNDANLDGHYSRYYSYSQFKTKGKGKK